MLDVACQDGVLGNGRLVTDSDPNADSEEAVRIAILLQRKNQRILQWL